jgi:hypothetical protein
MRCNTCIVTAANVHVSFLGAEAECGEAKLGGVGS